MITRLPIIIRIPNSVAAEFATDRRFDEIILTDNISSFLQFIISPDEYNAANPVTIEVKQGFKSPYAITSRDLYKIEAIESDARSHLKDYVLQSLMVAPGTNLSFYNEIAENEWCCPNIVAIEDYHVLDTIRDLERGYTRRVGVLQHEVIKGSYGDRNNISPGKSYVITPRYPLISGSIMNSVEWQKYYVINRDVRSIYTIPVADWDINMTYSPGDQISAIAPFLESSCKIYSKGIKLIFSAIGGIERQEG